jgi:hypothetical protein
VITLLLIYSSLRLFEELPDTIHLPKPAYNSSMKNDAPSIWPKQVMLTSRLFTVFSGPHALKPMLIGVSVGLPLGFILHHEFPHFVYTDIIALGVSTVSMTELFASHPRLQTIAIPFALRFIFCAAFPLNSFCIKPFLFF